MNADDEEFQGYRWGRSDAPALFLHHATGMCALIWATVAESLAADHQVFALDARGHGSSVKRIETVGWNRFSTDVVEMAELVAARFGVGSFRGGVGHSLGGVAILGAAVKRPGLFERLCLLDPALIPAPEPAHRNAMSIRTRLRQKVFLSREDAFMNLTRQHPDWNPEVLAHYVEGGLRETERGIELCCCPTLEATIYELGETEVLNLLSSLEAPTLIVSANYWRFRPGHDWAASKNSCIQVKAVDMGHAFPMESPEFVANTCRTWFS